jgi:hypothetical protein
MEQKLKYIALLTDSNNHGGARWHVTDMFSYLALYKRKFELIDKLHEIEGSMPILLSEYRNNVTLQMLHEIEKHEGFEIKNKIIACL